jgi:hypothetical protein
MTTTKRVPRAYRDAAEAAPRGVVPGQVVADVQLEDAVVFVIGMRINRLRKVRTWWPVFTGMPKMLKELQEADAGLLQAHTLWAGRVFLVIQYWRSAEELGAYARDSRFTHAKAWGEFNKKAAATGHVGIFHETYVVPRNRIETLYGNMAPFGLAAAHGSVERGAASVVTQANRRLATTEPEYVDQAS